MIDLYKYTDKEIKELIDSIVILVDTKEKVNEHITDWFDKKKIPWEKKSLDYGDYSFIIPANEKLGIPKTLDFSKKVIVERKGSLEELSGNLTKDRARLEKEFALAPKTKALLIENASYEDIANGNYDSKYNRKSFLGTLHSWNFKYNIPFFFVSDNKYSGLFIKMYFEYYLKNYLR